MSEYTEALSELVALPGRLDERLARSEREVAAERKRREDEIEAVAREHEGVVARLEAVLARARAEGVDLSAAKATDGSPEPSLSGDPIEYTQQLVGRLEEALAHWVYTRDALAAEEEKLSEEERRRAAEERRRREREELHREEQWERARQGTRGLLVALGIVTAAGAVAGLPGAAAVLSLPLIVAPICFALATAVASTLPARAVERAGGTMPRLPAAPPRERRLAAGGYAASGAGLCALGMALTGFLSGAEAVASIGALAWALGAGIALSLVWAILPHHK